MRQCEDGQLGTAKNQLDMGVMVSNQSNSWEGPLFIVGMPRSGTKLLRTLLGGHSRLRFLPHETGFMPFLFNWVGRNGTPIDERAFEKMFTVLSKAMYFDYRGGGGTPFCWRKWRMACGGCFDAATLFEAFARCELDIPKGSGVVWGDKTPSYIDYLPLIRRLYPDAKVVHIVRDVRDHCASIRHAWGKDVGRAAHRWSLSVLAVHECAQSNPDFIMEIRYEELLADAEKELRLLSGFLGVEYESQMLSPQVPTENLGNATGHVGIMRSNTGRYREKLSERELRSVEAIAWAAMGELGYQPTSASGPLRLSPMSLSLRMWKDGFNLALRDVESRGLARSIKAHYYNKKICV